MGCYACWGLLGVGVWSLVFWGLDVKDVFVLGFNFDLWLGLFLGFWGLRSLGFWFCRGFLSLLRFGLLGWFRLFRWFLSLEFIYSLLWCLSLLFRCCKIKLLFNFRHCFRCYLGSLRSYFLCRNFRSFIFIIRLSWRFSMFTLEIFFFH